MRMYDGFPSKKDLEEYETRIYKPMKLKSREAIQAINGSKILNRCPFVEEELHVVDFEDEEMFNLNLPVTHRINNKKKKK